MYLGKFRQALLASIVVTTGSLKPISAEGDTTHLPPKHSPHVSATRLSGDEILQAFTNVRDDARVQDAAQTRAVNYWHSDGKFISRWRNSQHAGEVTGTWRVKNDMRCVTITKGVPQRLDKESCGPIYQKGVEYLSFNADGSVHGIHTLTPLARAGE